MFWLLGHMYVELRIRNGDAELVERLLYVLKHGEVDGPVILGFHPQTELDGDCGISMTGNEHLRCGILQHIVVAGSCGEEDPARKIEIGIVGYVEV